MTDTSTEAVQEMMQTATPGKPVQFHPHYCKEAEGAPFSSWDSSYDLSVMQSNGKPYRIATFRHADDAGFDAWARLAVPALSAERDALRAQMDAADAAWCERVSLLEKALDARQAHDAQKLNDMVDNAIENLARAWASMDGKPFDDDGYREGYIADATELLDRSGIAAERAALRAQLDAAPKVKPLVWIECKDGTFHDPHCQYELETDGGFWRVTKGVTGGGSYVSDCSTLESAKAAAQADYERRILDALE